MVFSLAIICGFLYLYRGLKSEGKTEKIILIGFGYLFFSMALDRIIIYFRDFFIIGYYEGHIFMGDFSNTEAMYDVIQQIGHLVTLSGYMLTIFCFETTLKRTKYVLTIIDAVVIFLIIFVDKDIFYYAAGLWGLFFNFYFFMLLKESSKEYQTVFSLIATGIMFIAFGNSMGSSGVRRLDIFPLIIPPISVMGGFIVSILPMILNPKVFSRSRSTLSISLMVGCFTTMLIIICMIGFNPSIDLTTLIGFVVSSTLYIPLFFYLFYLMVKISKSGPSQAVLGGSQELESKTQDILRMFTRPQKVTEEEVSISKEKRTCLVCKGKVGRYNFICNDCGAFYCENCARTLTDLENACWVCETPFDESKPVKLKTPL